MKEMEVQTGIPFQYVPSLELAQRVSSAGPYPYRHTVFNRKTQSMAAPINLMYTKKTKCL